MIGILMQNRGVSCEMFNVVVFRKTYLNLSEQKEGIYKFTKMEEDGFSNA